MHPAFSVILFTTLSGAGFGLWAWLGLRIAFGAIILLTVTLVLLPVQLIGLRFDLKIRRRIPRLWHRVACRVLGLKVRVHGTLEQKRPLLLAANHASWKDILVLGSVATKVIGESKTAVLLVK